MPPLERGRAVAHDRRGRAELPTPPSRPPSSRIRRETLAPLVGRLCAGRPTVRSCARPDDGGAAGQRRGDPVSALAALFAPGGRSTAICCHTYELRLHRARGYGALKAILEILAEEEPLTLTEIAQRLQRTPGSTKDYLSWLEDVDLVDVAAEALQLPRSAAARCGCGCTAGRPRRPRTSRARGAPVYALRTAPAAV